MFLGLPLELEALVCAAVCAADCSRNAVTEFESATQVHRRWAQSLLVTCLRACAALLHALKSMKSLRLPDASSAEAITSALQRCGSGTLRTLVVGLPLHEDDALCAVDLLLCGLPARFPALCNVQLFGLRSPVPRALFELRLRSLSLEFTNRLPDLAVTDATLVALANDCPELEELELVSTLGDDGPVGDVTDRAMEAIGASCLALSKIDLRGLRHVTSDGYAALCQGGGLRHLVWRPEPRHRATSSETKPSTLTTLARRGCLKSLEWLECAPRLVRPGAFDDWERGGALSTVDVCVLGRCCPRLLGLSGAPESARSQGYASRCPLATCHRPGRPASHAGRLDADGGMPPNRVLIELLKRCSALRAIDIRASPAQGFLNDSSFECLATLADLELFRASEEAWRVTLPCLQAELLHLRRLHFFEPLGEDAAAAAFEFLDAALASEGFRRPREAGPRRAFLRFVRDRTVRVDV